MSIDNYGAILFISDVDYYSANSASHCNPENGACKCSVMNEQCTELQICSKDGACEGMYNLFIKTYIVPSISSVHSNIMFGINPILFLFYTRTHSSDNATTTIKSLQNHEISTW